MVPPFSGHRKKVAMHDTERAMHDFKTNFLKGDFPGVAHASFFKGTGTDSTQSKYTV